MPPSDLKLEDIFIFFAYAYIFFLGQLYFQREKKQKRKRKRKLANLKFTPDKFGFYLEKWCKHNVFTQLL